MSRVCMTEMWTASRADNLGVVARRRRARSHVRPLDRIHDVDDGQECIERGVDVLGTPNGRVPMQDLLEDLGIGAERFAGGDGVFECPTSGLLVRMGRPDQVHRDVGVDEDHVAGRSGE